MGWICSVPEGKAPRPQLALHTCVLCRGFRRLEDDVVIIAASSNIPEDGLESVSVPNLAFANQDHRSAQDKAVEPLFDQPFRNREIDVIGRVAKNLRKAGFAEVTEAIANQRSGSIDAIQPQVSFCDFDSDRVDIN